MTTGGEGQADDADAGQADAVDQPKPSWIKAKLADRWQTFVGSLPAVWLAVLFWRQDAIDPLTFPALLLDRGLQVLTLACIPGLVLVAVAAPKRALGAATFVAGTAIALSLAVLVTGCMRPPADRPVVGLAAVACACSSWLMLRFAPRSRGLRSTAGKIAAAVLASAVPLLQFWNGVSFLPSMTEASLGQELTITPVTADDREFRNDVVLRVKNDTSARVLVIITRLTVCWWPAEVEPKYENDELRDLPNCTAMRPLNQQSWVSPKTELAFSRAIRVPRNSPRVVAVSRLAFARGDRVRTRGGTKRYPLITSCQDVNAVRLQEESRVKGVAQEDKHLVYADKDGGGGVNYHFSVGSVGCPGDNASKLVEYFGTTESRTVFERWLTPPPAGRPG